ncbi:hypothetical protein [Methylosinus trichosporium]|uniref:Serine kinase n=2 Tax=Methylosinus TaxID=425 RepID=A0A2D2D4V6_METT3|nr:hypothetical protein [Methylosinus trichosporium]ATQ70051.1 hypothetical protein CQW49_20785 [Methylosinus trichosporium OB3b]OBS53040.1 hypothetical protein A8B73_07950 [Methylosinus sp. 3S-1]
MTTCDYLLCGLRLRSGLPLPELAPWPGEASGEADVVVLRAPVAEPTALTPSVGRWRIDANGAAVLRLARARIRVSGGRLVEIDARDGPGDGWRVFLLGSALGALFHQRGLLPLHAASLRLDAAAIAIAAPSGAGKSTLSSALARRGAMLLSDDLTVLRFDADGAAQILPAFPRLRLRRDSAEAQGLEIEGRRRVAGLDKYDLGSALDFDAAPRRLDAVLILRLGAEPKLRRLSKLEALPALWNNVFRRRLGMLLAGGDAFARAAALARATPVYEFARPKDFRALDADAALIEERFAAGAPG